MSSHGGEITQLLACWRNGDDRARETLATVVQSELRRIAGAYLRREQPGHTLQPTALVNEVWLRLVNQDGMDFESRRRFFALAAQVMRQVLTDYARSTRAGKHSGGFFAVTMTEGLCSGDTGLEEFLALNEALEQLAAVSPRQAQVIELRYFGGLNVEESAGLLGISPATISREQRSAEDLAEPRHVGGARLTVSPRLSEERWRQLDAVFQKALDSPPAERAVLIERETAGDPDLRREVEEMLACSGEAAEQIAGSIAGLAQTLIAGGDWAGKRVGPYRLIREIGRGGMGVVFEASRDDAEYRKQVALKLVPSWSGQPELIERFRRERQILAALEHPNIARFLDGGTEGGVPYFVMEYVDGVSLLEWRRAGRSVRESIDLFRAVCAAVHYAHENLIVHRDLKPDNILVNREGVPKLLDFGIAKALQGDPGATTGQRPWTPDYASPEQVRGGAIGTRGDVYSLGLILYELLCGERAQQPDLSSPLALDLSICETEPVPPSARAAACGDALLARQLAGDLDTIVAMAIQKDAKRRYGSAAALSADLERYLSSRPVQARPATVWYRAGKFIRRRRFPLAAAVLIAATAAAGIVSTVHQARRAERRFQQVRSLAGTFVFDVYDRIQFLPGATEARKSIVSTALRYLESLRPDAAGDPSLAIELAAAYLRIGDVQGHPQMASLHDTEGAFASYNAARGLLEPLNQRGDRRAALPLAQSEFKLGLIELTRGHAPAAGASFERALGIARRMISNEPNNLEALKLAGDITSELALAAVNRRDPALAQQAAQETVEVARRLVALQPGSITTLEYLANAQSSLGVAYHSAKEVEKAIASLRESAATREQMVAREPSNTAYGRALMMSYGHIADMLGPTRSTGGIGELNGALETIAKAIRIAEAMVQQDPSDRTARQDLASATYRLGDIHAGQGRAKAALAAFEKSEALYAGLLAQDGGNENARFLLYFVRLRSAETLETLGRDAEAARKLAAVRAMTPGFANTKDAANAHTGELIATIELARIEARWGDPSAASLAERAAQEAAAGPRLRSPWNEASDDADLGRLFLQLNQREQAAAWLAKSATVWKEMQVSALLESQRAAQLAAVEADFAKARSRGSSSVVSKK